MAKRSNIKREGKIKANEAYDLYREENAIIPEGFSAIEERRETFEELSPMAIKAQENLMWKVYLADEDGSLYSSFVEKLNKSYDFCWMMYCNGMLEEEYDDYPMSDSEIADESKAIQDFLYGEDDEEKTDWLEKMTFKSNRRRQDARAKKRLVANARVADSNMNVRKENDSMKNTFCKEGAGHWIIAPKKELMRAIELVKKAGKIKK